MDAIVTRTSVSFYCEDCAYANVKPIDLAGATSRCNGCKRRLRVPGARLQRPSERVPQVRSGSRRTTRVEPTPSSRSSSASARAAAHAEPRRGLLFRLAVCLRLKRAS
ncbi:MAG: hypothetical protein KDD82_27035 [Planctomycetes bacterium]|nr:hypothetical protein [Planctomycetota bacterium]